MDLNNQSQIPLSDHAWKLVLTLEGDKNGTGFVVSNPEDPGGPTKFGFAQNYNKDIDVLSLTYETAKERFIQEYWKPLQPDKLPKELAIALACCGFNIGRNNAVRKLQASLGVDSDGIIGEQTILFANRRTDVVNEFLSHVLLKYAVDSKKSFMRGHLKRVLDLKDAIKKMGA